MIRIQALHTLGSPEPVDFAVVGADEPARDRRWVCGACHSWHPYEVERCPRTGKPTFTRAQVEEIRSFDRGSRAPRDSD